MKILLVEDDELNARMLLEILSISGYEAVHARGVDEAIGMLETETIQMLVVDWMMPERPGIDLVRHVREHFAEPYRYIIMVTAKSEASDVLDGLDAGADDYMKKPINAAELRARIAIGQRVVKLENRLRDRSLYLERAKQEWEATTDSISQLICLINHEGRVIRANATIELWGLTWQSDAHDQSLADLLGNIYPDFAAQMRSIWPNAKHQLARGLEFEWEGKDAQRGHHFSVQYQPINPFGDISVEDHSFAAVSIQDITQRKQLELALQEAHAKSEVLLLNMLPAPIADRLKAGETQIADSFDDATVLFADLVGFTRLVDTMPPDHLIQMLNKIFSMFDDISEQHNVEKIKTIGDSYMAVGGIPRSSAHHPDAVMRMAQAMLKAVRSFNETSDYNLQLRIGINTGPVIAGVIGSTKRMYDIWGDTVNTASRMETTGVAGRIQVTQATYERVKDQFEFEPRDSVEVKGKGQVSTYLLK
jgi:adenylate cyclase